MWRSTELLHAQMNTVFEFPFESFFALLDGFDSMCMRRTRETNAHDLNDIKRPWVENVCTE